MKKIHIAILGYYGYGNTGDEAILDCLVTGLKAMDIDFRITVFSGDPEYTATTYGVEAEPNILPTSLKTWVVRSLGRNRHSFRQAVRIFRQCDVVLVGGGGLFFDSPGMNRFLLEMFYKINWAKRMGKTVVSLGVGVGPLHYDQSKTRLKESLNRIDLMAVRDHNSRELLGKLGVDKPPIHTTGDFVFLMDMVDPYRVTEIIKQENLTLSDDPVIGISVCGYHTEIPGFKEALAGFCKFATEQLRARVWFIPMQTGGGLDDRKGAHEIVDLLDRTDRIEMVEGKYTPQESMGLIAQTDAMLTERLHGVILGMMACTPVFGISYMPKVSRLFNEMGHDDWQVRLENLTAEKLIEGFDPVWSNRGTIAEELKQLSQEMKNRAQENFALLGQTLGTIYSEEKD